MTSHLDQSVEEPLMSEAKFSCEDDEQWQYQSHLSSRPDQRGRKCHGSYRYSTLIWAIVIPWTLLLILASWDLVRHYKQAGRGTDQVMPSQLTYSPAAHAVKYETRQFDIALPGLGAEENVFVGDPTPELEEAWKGLYPSLIQLIPQQDAAKLWGNGTVIFPHDEHRRYAIELDVFHELHCLNMIRKRVWSEYYTEAPEFQDREHGLLSLEHISHCIDQIRQSLMCSADITPYTWRWDGETQRYTNQYAPHTCRDFDSIREWAVEHTAVLKLDGHYREMNDPLDSDTWVDGYTGARD